MLKSSNLKRGDIVKVVVFDRKYGARIHISDRDKEYEVNRKRTLVPGTRSYRWNRPYKVMVEIRVRHEDGWESYLSIPADHVLKVNSKTRKLKEELMENES